MIEIPGSTRDNDLAFASHDVPDAVFVAFGSNDVMWNPYGPLWRKLRKVCVRDVLSPQSLKAVRPLRKRELQRMVTALRAKQESAVEIRETVFLAALNVMTSMLWGGTVDDEGIGKEFKQAMDGIIEGAGKANVSDFFPALARFDIQGVAGEMVRSTCWYLRIFDMILEERRKMMKDDGRADAQRDFLQMMLETVDKEGDSQLPLTIDHVEGLFLVK